MRALNRQDDEEYSLTLTPLIDLVFLLIVFFLVSTSFIKPEKSIEIKLPVADQGVKPPQEERTLVVNVREGGIMVVHGRVLSGYDELVETLDKARQDDPNLIVVIRGDRTALHKHVVRVMNAALSVGIGDMSIAVFDTEED